MATVTKLGLPGALIIEPKRFGDDRGFFSEVFNARAYAEFGLDVEFVQDNHSLSVEKGVIRGLHFQIPPQPQGKLVRVVSGAVIDVIVDIRKGSPTYGQHEAVELSAENWRQLWVPEGFAHAFCTLSENTEFLYKVTGYYAPDCDKGLAFDDPALGIDWPVPLADAILSDKDRRHPTLAELPDYFTYQG